jgi:outer membrane protein TolC
MARLEMVLFQYRDAERKMALYQKSLLPRAEQALEVIRSAFESGKTDFLDFIDSQRTLLEFELAYEEARTRRAQRLAELQMIVGKEDLIMPPADPRRGHPIKGGSFEKPPSVRETSTKLFINKGGAVVGE